jgi:hypothetical protein
LLRGTANKKTPGLGSANPGATRETSYDKHRRAARINEHGDCVATKSCQANVPFTCRHASPDKPGLSLPAPSDRRSDLNSIFTKCNLDAKAAPHPRNCRNRLQVMLLYHWLLAENYAHLAQGRVKITIFRSNTATLSAQRRKKARSRGWGTWLNRRAVAKTGDQEGCRF